MSGGRSQTLSVSPSYPVREDDQSNQCNHRIVIKRICWECKKPVEGDYSRAFDYLGKGSRLSDEAVKLIRRASTNICFSKKKLHLVLDLDHTLLDACRVERLSDKEKYLIHQAGSRQDLGIITAEGRFNYLVKFRPFVREFLRKASDLFEMYIYTKAAKKYAAEIVKLLDPQGVYFENRVITREESPKSKSLDLVLAEERGVIILDDTREAWPDHAKNLLKIKKYCYFALEKPSSESESYAEKGADEDEKDGALATVLEFLEELHTEFFSERTEDRDVRGTLMVHYYSSDRPSFPPFFVPCS